MDGRTERRRSFIINAVYFILIFGIGFLLFKYAVPYILPFIIGFAIAFMLKPIVRFLSTKLRLNQRFCGAVVILLAYSLLALALWFLGARLISALTDLFGNAEQYFDIYIAPLLEKLNSFTVETISVLSPDLAPQANDLFQGVIQSLQSGIVSLSGNVVGSLANIGAKIPGFLVAFAFTIMSSIFISMDYNQFTSFLLRQLPKRWRDMAFEVKGYFVGTILRYLRAYLILMIITFVELSIGFGIIGIGNPIGVAAIIALCDALPVLGTGGIVIPWILLELLKGNYQLVIGLTVVYIIVTVVRNFIEPKVIGQQLGLHPIVTLVSIYIGFKLIGVAGMILFPIFVQIIVSLNDSGSLRLWKT